MSDNLGDRGTLDVVNIYGSQLCHLLKASAGVEAQDGTQYLPNAPLPSVAPVYSALNRTARSASVHGTRSSRFFVALRLQRHSRSGVPVEPAPLYRELEQARGVRQPLVHRLAVGEEGVTTAPRAGSELLDFAGF